jgi:UDPglucose 6-dehydrogenase
MNITIFGVGYVGLVQAAVLAEVGHDVVCVDNDAAKIEALNKGNIAIYEPGLEALVADGAASGRLKFTVDPQLAVAHGDVQFIAVGTPRGEDGSADLRYVLAVGETIGRHMESRRIVVCKSTVPVGTCELVGDAIAKALNDRGRQNIPYDVVSNPEFLKEGSAVADCMRPDRIVVGTQSPEAEAVMRELYLPFNRNRDRMMVMDVRSAELTKYAANCMLATKISFMNEIANLSERLGADIEQVRRGIGSDQRIGYHFIYPGLGYGGSCFPKDIRALIRTAEQAGFDAKILKAVEQRNEEQKSVLFEKVAAYFGGDLSAEPSRCGGWPSSRTPTTCATRPPAC